MKIKVKRMGCIFAIRLFLFFIEQNLEKYRENPEKIFIFPFQILAFFTLFMIQYYLINIFD